MGVNSAGWPTCRLSIENIFWNTETSDITNMCGSGEDDEGCDDSFGKTTAEMQQQATFTDWDFINIWAIGENQTYPYLRKYLAADLNHDGIVNLLDIVIMGRQWLAVKE